MVSYTEIYTMKRSGNHAVLNWLFNQFDHRVLYFNNAKPGKRPFEEMRNPGGAGLQNIVDLMPYWRGEKPRIIRWDDYPEVYVQFEEPVPVSMDRPIADTYDVPIRVFRQLIILRDLYNTCASRIAMGKHTDWRTVFPVWRNLARLATSNLDNFISYNGWLEPRYRAEALEKLGLIMRNDDISFVSSSGGGSSFDKRRKPGSDLDTLNRWKILLAPEHRDLRYRLEDEEIQHLNWILFGMEYPLKEAL